MMQVRLICINRESDAAVIAQRAENLFLVDNRAVRHARPWRRAPIRLRHTTDYLPRGKAEIEQWITDRKGQAHGHFHQVEMRTEFEYGLTDDLQTSLYINYTYQNANANSVNHLTEGIDIINTHNPSLPLNAAHFDGFSWETIYRVLSPYKDPLGLAFYVEPEIGPREQSIELRTIVQKNFLDDRLVFAGNLWLEFERERTTNLDTGSGPDWVPQSGAKERATMLELDLGVSYRFAPNWAVGLEFRNHNEYGGYSLLHRDQDHTAFFLGPNIHYANERFFATLTILPQLGAIAFTPDQKAQIFRGRIYGDEHTRIDGIRLKIGVVF
jgi:uncharacterized protein DUF6662